MVKVLLGSTDHMVFTHDNASGVNVFRSSAGTNNVPIADLVFWLPTQQQILDLPFCLHLTEMEYRSLHQPGGSRAARKRKRLLHPQGHALQDPEDLRTGNGDDHQPQGWYNDLYGMKHTEWLFRFERTRVLHYLDGG